MAGKSVNPFSINHFSKFNKMLNSFTFTPSLFHLFTITFKGISFKSDGFVGSPFPSGNKVGNANVARKGF